MKQLTKKNLSYHHYVQEVWYFLGNEQKRQVLDIIADGKGIIPYEKIIDLNSLTPENRHSFEKTKF